MMGQKTTMRPTDTTHVKAFTGSHAATDAAISSGIYQVRVFVSDGAHVAINDAPAATTGDMPLGSPGGVGVEYFSCQPGDKVSAIGQSGVTSGTLYVTEMTS